MNPVASPARERGPRLVRDEEAKGPGPVPTRPERLWLYVLLGAYLGFVFTRGEVISWFRIQEMFRFQSFHMYGIIGSAVGVAALGVFLIRRARLRAMTGGDMQIGREPMQWPGWQYWIGGTIFGLGWGLTGACPGPIYVLLGNGVQVVVVTLIAALAGAWTYGAFRTRLPHTWVSEPPRT